jgi:hypothetical protein
MSRRKVDYVYVPKKKIKKVVIDAKRGRKSVEKTVNQRQILDGAYVRASAMKEFPNGKFAKGGQVEKAVTSTEYISKEEIKRFEDYVYDVYEEYGFTKPQVIQAVKKYVNHLEPNTQQAFTWGGGDSLDRERVYEYLLDPKLNHIKNPTFAKGGETAENTRYSVQVNNTAAYPNDKQGNYYIETTNKERAKEIAIEKFKKEFGTQRGISVYVNSVRVVPTEDGKERTRKYFVKIRNVKGSEKESYIIDAYEQDVAIQRAFKKFRAQFNRPPAKEDDPNVFLTQIDDAYPIAEIKENGVSTYKRKFAEGGITKSHISVGDIVLDKNDRKYYIVYEVKNDAATKRYFLPDEVAESVAAHLNPELIDWNKYTMYSDQPFVEFSVGDLVYSSRARKSGVIIGKDTLNDGEYAYSVKYANNGIGHYIPDSELELISTYKRGGNIGSYNSGRSWKQDHNRHNKSESYEIPMNDRKFAKGGRIENQYAGKSVEQVWNMWTPEQRDHFLSDHYAALADEQGGEYALILDNAPKITKMNWNTMSTKTDFGMTIYYDMQQHIDMGQYKRGGNIGSYNTGRSWTLDHNQHNKQESYEIPMDKRKFGQGGSMADEYKQTFVVDVFSQLGDDSYTVQATDGKQAFEEARYLFKKENPQYKGKIDLAIRDKFAQGGDIPDLSNMNIDHLFANGGRTYPTTEEKIYS